MPDASGVRFSQLKWGDLLVASLIVVAAFSCFLLLLPRGDAAEAVVTVDGREVARIALGEGVHKTIDVEGRCFIEIAGDRARFLSSDCPDQVCVHTGFVSKPGQSAVCLPNRVTLYIEGREAPDAVSR